MTQLQCASEVFDFAGKHQPRAFGELVNHPARVEERRSDLGAPISQGDAQPLRLLHPFRLGIEYRLHVALFGGGDHIDEGDVLALFEFLTPTEHRHAVAVLPRVVPQQVIDGAHAEVFLEWARRLLTEAVPEPVGQHRHGYSTPISSASPRWSV